MMPTPTQARLLLIDDDDDAREWTARALRSAGHTVTEAADGAEALTHDLTAFDMVLTDVQMPRIGGRQVLESVRALSPRTPVIAFTAYADAQGALDLFGAGAYDYLPRPIDTTRLKLLVQRALEWRRLAIENESLRREQASPTAPQEALLVGTSPAMLDVYKVVTQVAPTSATVLLVGESGTGKELVARTIHRRSGRQGPFVTLNCAALPEPVLYQELFGYEAGAFPEARTTRRGLFEEADGGTIFIDEIDEASPRTQAALLTVLEERTVRRIGGLAPIKVDARIVATTSRDLVTEAASGKFQEDLLFRIQVVTLVVPPLSARRDDVPLLIDHFLRHYATILGRPVPSLAPDAREALLAHDWPGNVRELAMAIERAIVVARGNAVLKDDLPPSVQQGAKASGPTAGLDTDWPTLANVERRYIDRVLQHTGGNKTRAAEVLGIDRRTLSRLFARERSAAAGQMPGDDNDNSR